MTVSINSIAFANMKAYYESLELFKAYGVDSGKRYYIFAIPSEDDVHEKFKERYNESVTGIEQLKITDLCVSDEVERMTIPMNRKIELWKNSSKLDMYKLVDKDGIEHLVIARNGNEAIVHLMYQDYPVDEHTKYYIVNKMNF